jgi:hypothetical protein
MGAGLMGAGLMGAAPMGGGLMGAGLIGGVGRALRPVGAWMGPATGRTGSP